MCDLRMCDLRCICNVYGDVLCTHVCIGYIDMLFCVNTLCIITITGSPQVIPGVSSVPFISTLLPLVLVLGVTAVKDAYDDVVSLIHVHLFLSY